MKTLPPKDRPPLTLEAFTARYWREYGHHPNPLLILPIEAGRDEGEQVIINNLHALNRRQNKATVELLARIEFLERHDKEQRRLLWSVLAIVGLLMVLVGSVMAKVVMG